MSIPKFVRDRNRQNSYADHQAQGYTSRPRYLISTLSEGGGGLRLIEDFPKWLTEQNFTPAQRRIIDELRPEEALTLPGVGVLFCQLPEEAGE